MASELPKIIKDTDTAIELIITDQTGAAIDLNGLSGLVIELFQKSIPFDKFSLNAQAGYRTINVTDAANGKVEIYLNAENTAKGFIGKCIFYEVKTEAVNVNFAGGTEEKSTGKIELAILTSSELKNNSFS